MLYHQSEVQEEILNLLEKITGSDEVKKNLDISLFDEYLLDSLGLIQLVVEISEAFSVEIPPAEVEREQWSSPRKIIENVKERVL